MGRALRGKTRQEQPLCMKQHGRHGNMSSCDTAQPALEAVWAVKFKMHIEDAGALPTGDHIEVLSDTQLQLVARLPHI
ncbi:hypothetical protein EYF80_001946 [Liparis tanakae]|uniref:Uncharacterized protein n=1 Tax=Liparis tanakae TaxID=230148 RepID=A0A4Z2JFE6_9TELE|nr:hypothetical protein EYF80_001946 [Liparis tanakae]